MKKKGVILVRAGDAIHLLSLSTRDVRLLDGMHFFNDDCPYRKLLGLDFIKGLESPLLDTPLISHNIFLFTSQMEQLLQSFETQKDLVSFDYSYSFDDEKEIRHGGARSGFRVEEGYGCIDVRPSGYCDLTIMNVGPNGKGRVHTIIDMRVKRQYPTVERGALRIYTRKAAVSWFEELEKLISFLKQQPTKSIEILLAIRNE